MHAPSRSFAALVAAGCLLFGCGDDDTGSADERGDVDTQIQDSGGGDNEGGDSGGTTDEGEGGAVEDGGTGSGGDGTGDSSGNDGDVESGG